MKMTEKETIEAKGVTKIHNVRFYNLNPRSINYLSFNKNTKKLALSRNDGSIEIWDTNFASFLEKAIPSDNNRSVEGLAWSEDRLFSVGLTGELVEWCLTTLQKKRSQPVTGNAIWCIDVDKNERYIAVGTEEGYLNVFEITEDGFTYKKLFDKQEGRILCCKYDFSGDFIVTGSIDVIRIWSSETGHALHKMALGRKEAKRETIVWSLQVLSNFNIISGDSRGIVSVWDGKSGTQIESHQAMKADVLSVAVNDDEDALICSGIEPVIKIYVFTEIKKEGQQIKKRWVKFHQRSVHDNDVKALTCAGVKIFSGGVDGYLGISSYSKFHNEIIKHGPFLQGVCASASPNNRLLLLRYCNYLEVWHLGKSEGKQQLPSYDVDEDDANEIKDIFQQNQSKKLKTKFKENQKFLSLVKGPEKLLELRSINDESIVTAEISPDGKWLVYSTLKSIRLFMLSFDISDSNENDTESVPKKIKINLHKIKEFPEQFSPSFKVFFSADSKNLFLIKNTNNVDIFSILSSDEIDYVNTIDISKHIKDFVNLAEISKCGKYLVISGLCRTISVWIRNKTHWKHYINLPRYIAPTTAIAIHPSLPRLVATFTDGKIFEYDLEEMRFVCSANEDFVPNSHTNYIKNIVLDPRNENVIILQNDAYLFVLEKCKNSDKTSSAEETVKKLMRTESKRASDEQTVLRLKFSKVYEHFVHLSWLSEKELIAVGVNPVTLIEQLPAAFRQKKFAAM